MNMRNEKLENDQLPLFLMNLADSYVDVTYSKKSVCSVHLYYFKKGNLRFPNCKTLHNLAFYNWLVKESKRKTKIIAGNICDLEKTRIW